MLWQQGSCASSPLCCSNMDIVCLTFCCTCVLSRCVAVLLGTPHNLELTLWLDPDCTQVHVPVNIPLLLQFWAEHADVWRPRASVTYMSWLGFCCLTLQTPCRTLMFMHTFCTKETSNVSHSDITLRGIAAVQHNATTAILLDACKAAQTKHST